VGIWESGVKGVGAKDDVAELNATRRDGVTKREIILAQKVGEVVKQNKKNAEGPSIQITGCRLEVCGFQEGCEEAQQRKEELVEGGPTLSVLGKEEFWHEHSVGDEAHP
jgi:hypothetical protein